MNYNRPLIKATLLKRYKRFLADIRLDSGECVTAHVANPGSMMGMNHTGLTVWIEENDDPKRKLNHSWKQAELPDGTRICVDTGAANKLVAEALGNNMIPELPHDELRAEVKYAENSRVDFLLTTGKKQTYVEVKSVTLSRETGVVEFPDSVTKRGTKHMGDLAQMVAQGHDAVILYLVNRTDAQIMRLASDIDPAYAASVHAALAAGVRPLCYDVDITDTGLQLGKTIPLALSDQSG